MSKVGTGVKGAGGVSDPQLLQEQEADGKLTQIHYAFEARLLPVAAVKAKCSFNVDNATVVDLVALAPAGATFCRLLVKAGGGDLSFLDNGLQQITDAVEGWVIAAGNAYDFPNLEDCVHIYVLSTSATAAQVRCAWYKRK